MVSFSFSFFYSSAQLAIKDLSWEDKELVLRVLFAKMNGVSAGSAKGAMHQMSLQMQASRRQEPMPEPVFLSEGATLPPSAGAADYQGNFEVVPGQHSSFRGASRGLSSAGDVDYGRDNYGFDAIGGGSLHSSQFGTAADSREQAAEDNVSMLASSIGSTNST